MVGERRSGLFGVEGCFSRSSCLGRLGFGMSGWSSSGLDRFEGVSEVTITSALSFKFCVTTFVLSFVDVCRLFDEVPFSSLLLALALFAASSFCRGIVLADRSFNIRSTSFRRFLPYFNLTIRVECSAVARDFRT